MPKRRQRAPRVSRCGGFSSIRPGVFISVSVKAVNTLICVRLPMVRICSTTSTSRIASTMTPSVSSSDIRFSRKM